MNPVVAHGLVPVGTTVPVNRKEKISPIIWQGICMDLGVFTGSPVKRGMTLKRRDNSRLILKLSGVGGWIMPLFNKGC